MASKPPVTSHLQEMLELRAGGSTLQEIGDRYGVTRERIRQVLRAHGVSTGAIQHAIDRLGERKCAIDGCKSMTPVRRCRELDKWLCTTHYVRHLNGQDMAAPVKVVNKSAGPCAECGRECGPGTGIRRCKGLCYRCYRRWAYHNLPGRKDRQKVASAKWFKRKWQEDAAWREKQKAYQREGQRGKRAAVPVCCCLTGADVGVPEAAIAYIHPMCKVHNT